jgi:hypothetical protein
MPEEVKPAESSPAAPAAPAAADTSAAPATPSYSERLAKLTPEEKRHWQMTGKLPEVQASATEGKPVKTAPESEPGDTVDDEDEGEPKGKTLTPEDRSARDKRNNERRWNKLQRDLGAKDAEIATLKSQLADKGKPAESAPAKHEPAKPAAAAARPKLSDFIAKIGGGYATYEDAVEAHSDAMTDYKWELRETKAKEESEKQKTTAAETQAKTAWGKKVEAAREKHGADFDQIAFSDKLPLSDAMASFIQQREAGLDVLHHLGKNLKEAKRIADLDPYEAIAELRAIEKELTKPAAPVKTSTDAPPPPKNVAGRATAVDDPIDAAYKAKDWKTYNRLMNERDLKKKGFATV